MKRVILDTNICGFILKEIDKEVLNNLSEKKQIVIYGNDVIRRELRDLPRKEVTRVADKIKNLRITLLSLYDFLVKETYSVNDAARNLADKYFVSYVSLGGKVGREKIMDEFLIVACATIKSLDIVVSGDNKTMLSGASLKSYSIVNGLAKKRTPQFIGFDEFKKEIKRCASL